MRYNSAELATVVLFVHLTNVDFLTGELCEVLE